MGKVLSRRRASGKRGVGAAKVQVASNGDPQVPANQRPRCLAVIAAGIRTGDQFAQAMSLVMADVIEGRLPVRVANSVTNAGARLLKVVEMQHKYGSMQGKKRVLQLAGDYIDVPN